MRGYLSGPGSGHRLAIWRAPAPLALPAPPGHVPERLVSTRPSGRRLGTVWAVLGAAIVGFLGASALIPGPGSAGAGSGVIGRSVVDSDGSWRFADTQLRGFGAALARLILPQPPAAPPEPIVAKPTLPPDVRSLATATAATGIDSDDTTSSLARLAETLERPAVDVGPFGEPLLPGDLAEASKATWSGGIGDAQGASTSLATPAEAQLAALVSTAAMGAPRLAARDRMTDAPAQDTPSAGTPPAAAARASGRGAEPRLLNPAQPRRSPPPPPAPDSPSRMVELPRLPEARNVAVVRPVPPPDGFATRAVVSVARPAAAPAAGGAAWMRHARPFEATDIRPRIAIVVTDLGLTQGLTDQAIHYLPGAITLAFNPFADSLANWVEQARRAGHEVLINLPLEAGGGAAREGQAAALVQAQYPGAEVSGRLDWALGRATGYIGVASFLGAGATGDDQVLRPILSVLRERGFIYVGRQSGPRAPSARLAQEFGVPHAAIDRQIDADPSREAIEQRLAELERAARETGTAVALVRPHAASFERLAIWHTSLEAKGIALAPITAVLNRQRNR